jgi:uncharacterized protein DUF535
LRQRMDNVLLHYRHELHHFDDVYYRQVYRGDGLILWEDQVGDAHFCILNISSWEYRSEGEVSAYLLVNGTWAGSFSYSFVNASSFGLPDGKMLFVTRNQVNPGPELDLFRRCYRHSSPQYFCLAAVVGVAMGNDLRSIAAISSQAQVNYDSQYDASFRNSYSNFWHHFNARIIDHQAHLLDVPLSLAPLTSVAAKHRARAAERRRHWGVITQRAESAIRARRRQSVRSSTAPKVLFYSACVTSTNLLAELGQYA